MIGKLNVHAKTHEHAHKSHNSISISCSNKEGKVERETERESERAENTQRKKMVSINLIIFKYRFFVCRKLWKESEREMQEIEIYSKIERVYQYQKCILKSSPVDYQAASLFMFKKFQKIR